MLRVSLEACAELLLVRELIRASQAEFFAHIPHTFADSINNYEKALVRIGEDS